MIASRLISLIKSRRGPIYVEVNNFNDTFYVQIVKSDLLLQIAKFAHDEETGFELGASGVLGKDWDTV
jgi:hypothetical protein